MFNISLGSKSISLTGEDEDDVSFPERRSLRGHTDRSLIFCRPVLRNPENLSSKLFCL